MDPQGSTPDQHTQGNESYSPDTNQSADNADQYDQPSQSQDNQDDGVNYSSSDAVGNQGYDDAPSESNEGADDTEDQSDDSQESMDQSQNSVDPELERWAASQNLQLNTETEINLAKRLRDTQKSFHNANQKSATDVTNEPSANGEEAVTRAKLARLEFLDRNPEARALEQDMANYAWNLKESGDEAGFEYYRNNWDQLYRIVKAEKATVEGEASYDAGRSDERKNLAKKQQASGPSRAASNSAPKDNKITDEMIGKMSMSEYEQFKKDNPDFNPFRF